MKQLLLVIVVAAAVLVGSLVDITAADPVRNHRGGGGGSADSGWRTWGANDFNWRASLTETKINTNNVHTLTQLWNFTAGGMSATPTTTGQDEILYEPDWSGMLWALNRFTGAVIWRQNITAILLARNVVSGAEYASRSSPAIDGDFIYVGTRAGAYLLKFERFHGILIWAKQLDTQPAAEVTASPVVSDGKVYIGISSNEEGLAANPAYPCCTFRGSMMALNTRDGSVAWKTYTVPDNGGVPGSWAGSAVWSSAPPIDKKRNRIYQTTGNLYGVPPSVAACINASLANLTANIPCLMPGDLSESFVAFDLDTGAVVWSRKVSFLDVWEEACGIVIGGVTIIPPNPQTCLSYFGDDSDFGQSPMYVEHSRGNPNGRDALYACQKSGMCYSIAADNGDILWARRGGPGSPSGGMYFGSATDGVRLFYGSSNGNSANWTLQNGQVITTANYGAMNLTTGQILWEVPVPFQGDQILGAISEANGVVYSAVMNYLAPTGGWFYAIDAVTGAIKWNPQLDPKIANAPSIVDGIVYIPTGYSFDFGLFPPPYKLFAFGLPPEHH